MKADLGPWGGRARAKEAAPVEGAPRQYACEQCAAVLHFEPGSDRLVCVYCGHANAVPEAATEVVESDLPDAMRALGAERPVDEAIGVDCGGCGASFSFEGGLHAGPCPFCGQPAVAGTGENRPIKPIAVAPFLIAQGEALRLLKEWLEGLWFAPSKIAESAEKPGSLHGRYLPYWTFDSRSTTDYVGDRGDVYYETQRVTVVIDGKRVTQHRRVPKIRWTRVSGRVRRDFDDVLCCATDRFDFRMIEELEPWDLEAIKPYSPDYLSGFESEGYRSSLAEGYELAKKKMRRVIARDVRFSIGGDQQRIRDMRTRHENTSYKHVLLPVWHAEFAFLNKRYLFLINGRTGEVHGQRPWSAWKIAGAVALGLIVAGGALALFAASEGRLPLAY